MFYNDLNLNYKNKILNNYTDLGLIYGKRTIDGNFDIFLDESQNKYKCYKFIVKNIHEKDNYIKINLNKKTKRKFKLKKYFNFCLLNKVNDKYDLINDIEKYIYKGQVFIT